MLISAITALFLIAFGLGVFWRSPNRHDLFFFSFSSMIKSFYLAWFVFLASYFTSLGQALPILSILFAGAAIVVLMGRIMAGAVQMPAVPGTGTRRLILVVALAAGLGLSLVAAVRPIGDVFTTWDALVSWNRWAIELSANQYRPLTSAYPILMPALWSLIYEAQSNSALWYFSRALMSVIPLGVMALVAYVGLRRGVISFLALFLPLFFGFISKDALYSGYMDQPSAILAVAGLLVSTLALSETESSRRNEFLMLGVMSVALAVLTKQHAIFSAFAVCSLVAVMAFRRQISFVRAGGLAVLFLVPVLSFLFIYFQQQDALLGNLHLLNNVADKAAAGQSKVLVAAKRLSAELPLWLWLLVAGGTLLNLASIRKPEALFALLIAALTIPGFLMYADCCSYSERNGIWILGHLSVSCYVGVTLFVEMLGRRNLIPRWLVLDAANSSGEGVPIDLRMAQMSAVIAALGLLLISNEWPISRVMERQLNQQRYRILPRLQTMLNRNPGMMDFATTLVTPVQLMRFHPDVTQTYRYCQPMKLSCFEGTPEGKTLFVTASWFENEESLAMIDRFVAEGRFKYLDQERGMRVYKLEKTLTDDAK